MPVATEKRKARSGTFIDNLKLPVHRWFRYSAGFSAEWVKSVIEENRATSIFDPFVGSGTTLLAGDSCSIPSEGIESHVFVKRIADAKLSWDFDRKRFADFVSDFLARVENLNDVEDRSDDKLLGKIYDRETLSILERFRLSYLDCELPKEAKEAKLIWLGITSILRPCSHAGTAQWQYVLPNKKKNSSKSPFDAFNAYCDQVVADSFQVLTEGWHKNSSVSLHDARETIVTNREYDLLVTSPPYPNNYDYADATRLEMTFWKEVEGWKDLQSVVRKNLLRSCSQHSAAERLDLNSLLKEDLLSPVIDEIRPVCETLAEVRMTKGGKKTYHTMVAAYFSDLAKIFSNLRPIMAQGSKVCFVIGDSAPYGVHVPADRWLGELAVAAGFKGYSFEKLRDRNIKWDNRVHKVPLHEGNLWIEG
ncbi:hypothetical protein [Cerasicoccus maritimus]|uniref:hypothetical protein n=1 Tax=Cerasicoccus maritimus TaxID=490089 RepID=UPI0028528E33|nr:hypothetical protein [Cerasicoccus maritimus]